MIWKVRFSEALRADLDAAGPALFERAGAAVLRFAERGEGTAYPIDVDASVWRFFVPGGQVYVRADLDADVLDVMRIVPDQPLPTVEPLLDKPDDEDDDD